MSDLFNLAERIVNYVREGGDRPYGTYEVVVVDRILREDRAMLGMQIGCIMQDLADGGIAHDDARHMIVRVLEGGEQASTFLSSTDDWEDGGASAMHDKHEFVPTPSSYGACMAEIKTPGGSQSMFCGRPADDPIHEVKDDNDRLDNSGTAVPGGAEADVLDSGQDTPVTVGPGDWVTTWRAGEGPIYKALWENTIGKLTVERGDTKAIYQLNYTDGIYTPDGRPVSGFREPHGRALEDQAVEAQEGEAMNTHDQRKKTMTKKKKTRPVIICTSYRGVFFGYSRDTSGDSIHLIGAKMAIYWGTTRGVHELAHTGPTSKSKISAPADIEVRGITAVMEVTPEAEATWKTA